MTLKRTFDLAAAALGLVLLAPVFLALMLWIRLDAPGPVFFRQERVGKGGRPFRIHKFRTMVVDAEALGRQITAGADPRITRSGHLLRKYKLDELPQLIDVLLGDMSLVGPRPEVPRYVALYTEEQRRVLDLVPGVTDLASLRFHNESELLAAAHDPERMYIERIMPEKIRLNLAYADNANLLTDIDLILHTLGVLGQNEGWVGEMSEAKPHPLYRVGQWSLFAARTWSRRVKQGIMLLADAVLLPLSLWLALSLGRNHFYDDWDAFVPRAILLTLLSFPVFVRVGLYRAVIRYLSSEAYREIGKAVALSAGILLLIVYLWPSPDIARLTPLRYFMVAFFVVGGSRWLARALIQLGEDREHGRVVAIYGAGAQGRQVARMCGPSSPVIPVVFLDDEWRLHGRLIEGLPVLDPRDPTLAYRLKARGVQDILFAVASATPVQRMQIIRRLEGMPFRVRNVPAMHDLLTGKASLNDLGEVSADDLLGREAAPADLELLARCVTGKRVLVTGAGGGIGAELCHQIMGLKPERLVLLDQSENALYYIKRELRLDPAASDSDLAITAVLGSTADERRMHRLLTQHGIQTVYHAAGNARVLLLDQNPAEAIRNNVLGTAAMARAAQRARVEHFVLLSTDKAAAPVGVLDASKRLAELVVLALAREPGDTRFCIVRLANLLGPSGSVVPLFWQQIRAGGPITLTHFEATRFFLPIAEAARLVIQASALAKSGQTFLCEAGEPIRVRDLAMRMVHLCGYSLRDDLHPHGDIEIRAIGLRPGEPLHERAFGGCGVIGTRHPNILRTEGHGIAWSECQELLTALEQAMDGEDDQTLRETLLRTATRHSAGNDGGPVREAETVSQPG